MIKHTKRLMLVFNIWHINGKKEELVSEYDFLKDLKEDLQGYIEICKQNYTRPIYDENCGHPKYKPELITESFPAKFHQYSLDKYKDYSEDNAIFYGWTILNFETEKFTTGGDICEEVYLFSFDIPKLKRDPKKFLYYKKLDEYFRRDDEIPENYKWDDGEYDGWLQYRWGDGRNKI